MSREMESLEREIEAFIGAPDPQRFGALALRLFQVQYAGNGPYRRFVDETTGGATPTRWEEIPAVPQDAFKHSTLVGFPEEQIAKTFLTSGTTGRGAGAHHFRSTKLYEASILNGWRQLGLPAIRRCIIIPPGEQATGSSLSHMMSVLSGLAGGQEFCVDRLGAPDYKGAAASLRGMNEPVMLMGTALALNGFVDWLEGESVARCKLPRESYLWETGGYKAARVTLTKDGFVRRLCEAFGVPRERVINEYGMTELSSQFYAVGAERPHRGPAWLRARVIDPETGGETQHGEVGILRLYDLANTGSVMAVETQDLAVRRAEGFELIGRDPGALPRGCSLSSEALLMRREGAG